jgi:uncharacterized protein (DUF927 family)
MEISKMKLKNLVRLVSTIHDIDNDRYSIEIEFRDVEGNTKRTVIPRSLIRSGSKALDELLQRGANLPGRHGAGAELRDLLSAAPGAIKRVTGRIGWHGQSFVLADVTIGPDSETLRYRANEQPQEDAVKGSLDDWRTQLSAPCQASSYSTFGIAAGFAGPLLELLGQDEGGTFYLFGESSTGKTLATLTGQSVIGPASRTNLITHDITPRALEEAAAAHNDLMLVLEEIDRNSGTEAERRKHVRQAGHTLAAGVGRRRSAKATQDSSLANLYWRFFSLWSGETLLMLIFWARLAGGEK